MIGRLLTEARIRLYASGIVFAYLVALAIRLARHRWVWHPVGRPCTDFIWIWLSGKFAASPVPATIYDHAAFLAAKTALPGLPDCILGHFDNPPTILFLTWPLGFLPYPAAFAVWLAATLLVYLAAVYAILPRGAAVLAAVTPFPVFFNVLLGHGGFLTAGLAGLALAAAGRRPLCAGVCLGLLTYKPQLGILFPLALVAARDWRTLLAATVASLLLAALAALAFGPATWPAFFGALAERATSLGATPRQAFAEALVSVFGVLRTVGAGAAGAAMAQLAVSAAVAAIVCVLWARPIAYSLKAAALAVGSLAVSPHTHGYDVLILTIGVAFLAKDGLARGFLPFERGILLVSWLALFLLTGPIPVLVSVALLVLVLRRVVRLPRAAGPAPDRVLRLAAQEPAL